MNVPFQVKVPLDCATALRDRLNKLAAAHAVKVEVLRKKIQHTATPLTLEALNAEQAALREAGCKLTINNLMRVVFACGMEGFSKIKDDTLVARMTEEGLSRGRPRSAT